jgi:flagellar hook-length control protein FliK
LKTLKLAPKSEPAAKTSPAKDSTFDAELEKAKPKRAAKPDSAQKADGKRKGRIVVRKSRPTDGPPTEKIERVKVPPVEQPKLIEVQEQKSATNETAQASATETSSVGAKQIQQDVLENPTIAISQSSLLENNQTPDATRENARSTSQGPARVARAAPNAEQFEMEQTAESGSLQTDDAQPQTGDRAQQQPAEDSPRPASFKRLPGSIEPAALGETAPPLSDQPDPEVTKSVAQTTPDVAQATDQQLSDLITEPSADAVPQAAALPPAHHDADAQEAVVSLFQQKLEGGRAVEHAPAAAQPAPAPAPEAQFTADNHHRIISGIRGELIPGGGTMHIRLDPPELGALQVTVHMEDGVMSAMFQTSTDDATRLLSHSLSQLKHVLETQGVSVEKLHVQQSPRDERQNFDDARQQRHSEDSSAQQEQQRREMLRRMWRRLTDGSDPLDMVA